MFASTGRRLVYTQGIYGLAILTAALLILFKGVTDRLIPLYAVGAFMAFTLSQAGMVIHWKRQGGGHWNKILVNGLGAFATAITTIVVLSAKFLEGAWVTVLLIPIMLTVMVAVHRHYKLVKKEIATHTPADFSNVQNPIVVTPMASWTRVTKNALRFSYTVSHEIKAIHVAGENEEESAFCRDWVVFAEEPARAAGLPAPELVVLDSPYRWILRPIFEYIIDLEKKNPTRQIAVVLPEMVEHHWYHYLLHNQRAAVLKTWLLLSGSQRIIVINVPWYLKA
jgi:hypothetical protein